MIESKRSIAMQIVERYPAELRQLIAGEDRLRAAGHADEADMAFDTELAELADRVEVLLGDDVDSPDALDAIGEAVEVVRARDARAARAAADELRAEATCHGCYGDGGAR